MSSLHHSSRAPGPRPGLQTSNAPGIEVNFFRNLQPRRRKGLSHPYPIRHSQSRHCPIPHVDGARSQQLGLEPKRNSLT